MVFDNIEKVYFENLNYFYAWNTNADNPTNSG